MLKFNEYFTGKVKSIGFNSDSIGPVSVGVMEKGEYNFSTAKPEEMTVITGSLKALIPGSPDWQIFTPGENFMFRRTVNLLCKLRKHHHICVNIYLNDSV
ncbi:hypothetical protein yaldo0001_37000 [Yersinia aldovae ATCC 35236]|nr:hypothetical protein yaldo0001_37000 [Yersinia aldovae ATCC 35236]